MVDSDVSRSERTSHETTEITEASKTFRNVPEVRRGARRSLYFNERREPAEGTKETRESEPACAGARSGHRRLPRGVQGVYSRYTVTNQCLCGLDEGLSRNRAVTRRNKAVTKFGFASARTMVPILGPVV